MRKIRVISTNSGVRNFGAENELTLQGLIRYLDMNDISYQGMKIMVVQTKTTLEHQEAMVPDGDITISLSQANIKAGSLSYNEMKAFVKERRRQAEVTKDQQTLELIGDYTRLTTDAMTRLYQDLVSSYVVVAQNGLVVDSQDGLQTLVDKVNKLSGRVASLEMRVAELDDSIEELEEKHSFDEEDEDVEDDIEDDGYTDEEREWLNSIG